jgi:hypothetical protein
MAIRCATGIAGRDQLIDTSRRILRPGLAGMPRLSLRVYTPGLSASRHRPLAQFLGRSTDPAAVTVTGTTFWAAAVRGRSRSAARRQHADFRPSPLFIPGPGLLGIKAEKLREVGKKRVLPLGQLHSQASRFTAKQPGIALHRLGEAQAMAGSPHGSRSLR